MYEEAGRYALSDSKSMATTDHLIPVTRGGRDSPSNTVLACKQCNSQKANRTLEEYRDFLAQKQDKRQAAKQLMQIAEEFDLPALQRAAGRLLHQIDEIVFHGESQ
jgi:CRISPR/Cas system Type II protein with McrA/HNH and RuvC-like nuclease domain